MQAARQLATNHTLSGWLGSAAAPQGGATEATSKLLPRPRCAAAAQVDAVPLPVGPENPSGMGFVAQETKLASTAAAQRKVNFDAARIWKVRGRAGAWANQLGAAWRLRA